MSWTIRSVVCGVLLLSTVAVGDSIRIGGVLHEDVYVGVTRQYYFVHFPEEGRVEKISRARRGVTDVVIDTDESARQALLARYEEVKSGRAEMAEAERSETLSNGPKSLDSGDIKRRDALLDDSVFALRLRYWKGLTEGERLTIKEDLLASSQATEAQRARELELARAALARLESEKNASQADIAAARARRDTAFRRVERYRGADIFLDERQKMIDRGQAGRPGSRKALKGNVQRRRAVAKAEGKVAAMDEYRNRVAREQRDIANAETGIRQKERDALSTRIKNQESGARLEEQLAQIDALNAAVMKKEAPSLTLRRLASWSGDNSRKSEAVEIEEGPWYLSCLLEDSDYEDGFAVTVYESGSSLPFTRISGEDFLGMRARVFENPGSTGLR